MKHLSIFLIVLFLGMQQSNAQQISFGDSTIVSLITCEPGDEVYAKFGHTAIRIRDTEGLDFIFNYGLFDFRTDYFYWKFMRGHTDYLLGISYTDHFLNEYSERNSNVWEQELNLNRSEKQKLIALLRVNYEPQNRMYRYNFVFDNCSTRPQDIIQKSINGVIVDQATASDATFREIISKFLKDDPWIDLGINMIFGVEADRIAGEQGKVFIPEHLKSYFQRAKVLSITKGGGERTLVSKLHQLVQAQDRQKTMTPWWLHPMTITMCLFFFGFLIALNREKQNDKVCRVFDTVMYLLTGVAGVVIFFFSFFSKHPLVPNNLLLLWLSPLNIVVAYLIWNHRAQKFLFFYNIIYLLMMLTYVLVIAFSGHSVVPALIPLLALLLIRILRREQKLLYKLLTPTSNGFKWKN